MLTKIKQLAKKTKILVVHYHIFNNLLSKRRIKSGDFRSLSGSTHNIMTLSESLCYIKKVFEDYINYSGISANALKNKRILEIGPGDNLGVALQFLAVGARQVVCLDRFISRRNTHHEYQVYEALRAHLNDDEKGNFDTAINLDNGLFKMNQEKLVYIYGKGIEEAENLLEPNSFDFIVSRAVIEHLYNTDIAFSVMNKLLKLNGYMLHKIDFRDHGMFSSNKSNHPLMFLTISKLIYKFMTSNTDKPNRKLINYYQSKMIELNLNTKLLITHIIGEENEVIPHTEAVDFGIHYTTSTIALIDKIRPYLLDEFKNLSNEELMIDGIFLIARKPSPNFRTEVPIL